MDDTVPTYGLLHITRAYNRAEISFDEWLRLSKEWAERIIRQAADREQRRIDVKPVSRGTEEVC
jgi:hypothetical protein